MTDTQVVDDESAGRPEEGVVQQRLVAGFSSDALLHRMLAAADALTIAAVAVIVGVVALFITYTADEVAAAQDTKEALDAGEL